VMPRVKGFSVEIRHDEEGTWETWYNGADLHEGMNWLNLALKDHPAYPLYVEDKNISGYLYRIRDDFGFRCFFKHADTISNPFYNRKVYANSNPDTTVSFRGINL
jgi:hypothetical protein